MRHRFARSLLSLCVFSITASPVVFAEPTSVGQGEGRLDIIAWPGYIERGTK